MSKKYNRFPKNKINGYSVTQGYMAIYNQLKEAMVDKKVLVMETYPGVYDQEVCASLSILGIDTIIETIDLFKSKESIQEQLAPILTEDRVFAHFYYGEIMDFIDSKALEAAKEKVQKAQGQVLIYGFGATLVHPGDVLAYLDMARWEITMRYRAGMPNYKAENYDEDSLKKIKRGYYVEWRIADKHKMTCFEDVDYFIDTNIQGQPKMVEGQAIRSGLKQIAKGPFRMVPYFDPGVWGGQWMKEVCNLDKDVENYAWSFDGVPEENSLYLDFENDYIEIPCMDLVLYQPKQLLGSYVYARFGAEFPIRFDFLDTMGGQNLSLQVHPLTEYIHRQFGMAYTQDESYYILDAKEDGTVFLGVKENIDPDQMFEDLEKANQGLQSFDASKYVNEFPAKKHDHFLIPAGTIHCSGSNSMILEISATPFNFTFKLWDWDRVGLDGKPRPVHLEHGKKNVQWDRVTPWVKENLINAVYTIEDNEHYIEEHTGLHELEFIETRRYWIQDEVQIENDENVNMMNLVEGQECQIVSLDESFEPFTLHYAETMIVPASVHGYKIVNPTNKQIGIIRAYVRK